MLEDLNGVSNIQLDALREVANIGAANAATALAAMLKAKFNMNVPRAEILPFAEAADLMGGTENPVVAIYFHIDGSTQASFLLVMPIDKAKQLAKMLLGNHGEVSESGLFTELEYSTLMELGNILSSSYLNALAKFTKMTYRPSVPAIAIDMAGAILDAILARYGSVSDMILVMEAGFKKDNLDVAGDIFLLPEPGTLSLLLNSIGVTD